MGVSAEMIDRARPSRKPDPFRTRAVRVASAIRYVPLLSLIGSCVARDAMGMLLWACTAVPTAVTSLVAAGSLVSLAVSVKRWPLVRVPWDPKSEQVTLELDGHTARVLSAPELAERLEDYAEQTVLLVEHRALRGGASPYRTGTPTIRAADLWRGTRSGARALLAGRAVGWLAWAAVTSAAVIAAWAAL